MSLDLSTLSNPVLKMDENCKVERVNEAAGPFLEEWGKQNGESLPPKVTQYAAKAMEQMERMQIKREVGEDLYLLIMEPLPNREAVLIEAVVMNESLGGNGYCRTLLEHCPDVIYQLDPEGYIQFINDYISCFGYRSTELIDQHITTIVHPDEQQEFRKHFVLQNGEDATGQSGGDKIRSKEIQLDLPWEADRVFEVRSVGLTEGTEPCEEQQMVGTVGVIREITEKHRIREELKEKEKRLRTMAENFDEVFWMFDGSFENVIYVNDQVERIYGITPEELKEDGRAFFEYIYPEHRERVRQAVKQLCNGKKVKLEYRVNKQEDFRRWVSVQGVPILENGSVDRIIGSSREITERKQYEQELEETREKLREKTYEDPLLGIPNRRLFAERFQQEWARARRESDSLSMLMVDIDHFKEYNDYYGHQQGDRCLHKIANTLQENLHRETDFVARYGGEEFAILLPNTDKQGLETVGERLRKAVCDHKILHESSQINEYVTISLGGGTVSPDGTMNRESFLNVVDKRLYKAKESGRNELKVE